MFGSEIEYNLPLTNSMRIAIVSYNIQNIELATKIQEKIIISNKKKLQITHVENISDLFKYKEIPKEEVNNGLINKKWINNIINFVPSVIILNYQLQSGINRELEEKNIYLKLEEIRNNSKTCFIILVVINKDINDNTNKFYLNFDDKQKPYYFKNYLTKDCFYIFQNEQIWKFNEFENICSKILNFSRQFYKNLKKDFQEKRSQSTSREEKIENDIKLGVLSAIKSRKEDVSESKYLEEAYEILCDKNYDLKTYKYGNKPISLANNFYEIRAAADWLFFKSNNFQKNKRRSSIAIAKNKLSQNNALRIRACTTLKININKQIKKSERHIYTFTNKNYFENGKKDYFHFVEYYWLIQRYKYLKEFIENKKEDDKVGKKISIKLGNIYFKETYNLLRMIIYYQEYLNDTIFKLNEINVSDKKIEIKDIQQEDNIYFGKPPFYFLIDKDNSNKKEMIGFNDEIYIKKFIINNKINYDDMIDEFKNKCMPNLSAYYSKLKSDNNDDKIEVNKNKDNTDNDDMRGINIYINKLKIALNKSIKSENIFETIDAEFYKKTIYNYRRIKIFPKVYQDFIKQYIDLIQYKMKIENNSQQDNYYKTELFISLCLLGNVRQLDTSEENIFYQLLNDKEFVPGCQNKDGKVIVNLNYYNEKNTGIIKCDKLAFNVNYSIKDIEKYQERKLLDIVEYEIKFNSSLNQEKMKLNSLQLFFEYFDKDNDKMNNKKMKITPEGIIKEFNKDELSKYDLGLNSPINIIYKLLLKYKTGKILLTKIMFTLCKKENIFFSIDIPNELNKTIFLSGKETKVLNIQYPKKLLTLGLNQLFKFEYIINKEPIENISITDYKHTFEIEQMSKNKLISKIQDKNLEQQIKNIKNRYSNSINVSEDNKEEINSDTLINFLFNESSERHLTFESQAFNYNPPSFFFFDETKNCIEESKNMFEYIYNNFESRLKEGKNKYDTLIKFSNYGVFMIKLNINYYIQHNEVDAKHDFNHEVTFYIKVIDPLFLKNKITSENYVLYNTIKNETTKEYLTNTNINMNLIFKNLLDEDILIKDIIVKLKEIKDIEINSTVKEIIDSNDIEDTIKEQILIILQSSNYSIPFNIKFISPYNGSLGKLKIIWTTKSLKEFENNKDIKIKNTSIFKNESEYILPNIDVNRIKINYDYNYTIRNDNEMIINIKIYNNSMYNKDCKRLLVSIENNEDNSYIISGLTKYFINLKYKETKKIYIKLIILQKGEIKLPDIVSKELDHNGNVLSSINYCPEKIILQ